MYYVRSKSQKLFLVLSISYAISSCTMIDSQICAGCQRPLSKEAALKYKNTSLADFMRERFTDQLGRTTGFYNKETSKNSINIKLLSSRIERPYDDINNFCQAQGGILVIKQAYYNPPPGLYISEDDIKQDVFYTYKNAKASAPSQITINNMIGSETYNINKQDYALSAAQNEYLRLKHNANITNSSFEAQDYRKAVRGGKIGKYSCIKNQTNLWWASIKPYNVEKDGSYTWINTQLTFSENSAN